MYRIRKFINHIYKTIDDNTLGYYQVDIHVSKYRYVIHNSKNSSQTNVTIYTNKPRYINISDCVTRQKKNTRYDYSKIKNKLIMYTDDTRITIIDKGVHITKYNNMGYCCDIIITHDDVLIF